MKKLWKIYPQKTDYHFILDFYLTNTAKKKKSHKSSDLKLN